MMKRVLGICVVSLLLGSAVRAADSFVECTKDKAVRGAVNMVTGIVELPMQVCKGYKNGVGPIKNEAASKTVGTILGFYRGIAHGVGRTGWGALELFGCWTANPEDNKGIGVPLDAEYAWEWGDQYSIFKPTLKEGVAPIGRKIVQGAANSFTAIAELPGQTIKGVKDGEPVKGLGRGVWYWWSRQGYGAAYLIGFLAPNPPDNPGLPLNSEWPWSALVDDVQ